MGTLYIKFLNREEIEIENISWNDVLRKDTEGMVVFNKVIVNMSEVLYMEFYEDEEF